MSTEGDNAAAENPRSFYKQPLPLSKSLAAGLFATPKQNKRSLLAFLVQVHSPSSVLQMVLHISFPCLQNHKNVLNYSFYTWENETKHSLRNFTRNSHQKTPC